MPYFSVQLLDTSGDPLRSAHEGTTNTDWIDVYASSVTGVARQKPQAGAQNTEAQDASTTSDQRLLSSVKKETSDGSLASSDTS